MFNKKGWIIPAIILILSVAGLLITLKKSSFDYSQINVRPILFYMLLLLFHYFISSLPTPIYVGDHRYTTSFLIHRLSLISSYLFPLKIGVPMKIYFFKRYLGVSISKTSASIIFESIVGVGIMFVGGVYLGSLKYFKLDFRIILVLCLGAAILGFVFLKNTKRLMKFSFFRRLVNFLISVKNSLIEVSKKLDRVSLIVVITLIITVLSIYRTGFLLSSIHQSLSFIQITRALFISTLITMASMIPGGYAVREASLSLFLVKEGIPLESALIVAFLDRIITTVSSFILGIVSALILMRKGADLGDQQTVSLNDK